MADFVKYNGYSVKDASALAHISLSGSTLNTTDRKGRPVDSVELPGGLALSATHMSYWPKKLTQAYSISSRDAFRNSNVVSDLFTAVSVGQVIGSEMIGYGEIGWNNTDSHFTLSAIRALTTHGWQTFTKDITQNGASDRSTYRNDLCRQFRPTNYKAYLNVGMKDKSITIAAGATQTIFTSDKIVYLKDPGGIGIGCASIVKAIPTIENVSEAGLSLYFGKTNINIADIVAYNPTSSSITIQSFVLELEVTLYNTYAEQFFFNAPDAPFIEGINCVSLEGDGSTTNIVERTSVVVKHHDNTSGSYLIEAKLTLNPSTGEWSWVKNAQQALGQGPIEGNNHNLIYTFDHTILSTDGWDFNSVQHYTSAVAYAIGGSGSSIGLTRGFTDAIPIPAWSNAATS